MCSLLSSSPPQCKFVSKKSKQTNKKNPNPRQRTHFEHISYNHLSFMLPINKASQLTQCSICSGQCPVPHRVWTCSAPTAKSIVLRSSTYRMQRKVLFSKVLVYEFIVMLLYYEPVLFQCYIFFFPSKQNYYIKMCYHKLFVLVVVVQDLCGDQLR